MREIKYRAWVLGKMYDVAAMDWNEYGLTIHTSGGFMTLPDEEVDLMQFTGLKDENGREIYEGDIVRGTIIQNDKTFLFKPEMKWSCGCCSPFYGWEFSDELFTHHIEVIGNMFENPELLEVSL